MKHSCDHLMWCWDTKDVVILSPSLHHCCLGPIFACNTQFRMSLKRHTVDSFIADSCVCIHRWWGKLNNIEQLPKSAHLLLLTSLCDICVCVFWRSPHTHAAALVFPCATRHTVLLWARLSLPGRCCQPTIAWTSRPSNAWAPSSAQLSTLSPSSTSPWAETRLHTDSDAAVSVTHLSQVTFHPGCCLLSEPGGLLRLRKFHGEHCWKRPHELPVQPGHGDDSSGFHDVRGCGIPHDDPALSAGHQHHALWAAGMLHRRFDTVGGVAGMPTKGFDAVHKIQTLIFGD